MGNTCSNSVDPGIVNPQYYKVIGLGLNDVTTLYEFYATMDPNGSGFVDGSSLLLKLNLKQNLAVQFVFDLMDTHGDHRITFREFALHCWYFNTLSPSELAHFVFRFYCEEANFGSSAGKGSPPSTAIDSGSGGGFMMASTLPPAGSAINASAPSSGGSHSRSHPSMHSTTSAKLINAMMTLHEDDRQLSSELVDAVTEGITTVADQYRLTQEVFLNCSEEYPVLVKTHAELQAQLRQAIGGEEFWVAHSRKAADYKSNPDVMSLFERKPRHRSIRQSQVSSARLRSYSVDSVATCSTAAGSSGANRQCFPEANTVGSTVQLQPHPPPRVEGADASLRRGPRPRCKSVGEERDTELVHR